MEPNKQPTCDERIDDRMQSTLADIRELWKVYTSGEDEDCAWLEYGLSFDYVAPGTFTDQEQGYFRYQISWGGPAEEFRFYVNPDLSCYMIEFWFLDWFDGARRALSGEDKALMLEVYEWFREIGSCQAELDRATED